MRARRPYKETELTDQHKLNRHNFTFVPKNQIGSFSGYRQHMCELSLYIVDHIQIYVTIKMFCIHGVMV